MALWRPPYPLSVTILFEKGLPCVLKKPVAASSKFILRLLLLLKRFVSKLQLLNGLGNV